jgi:hypothetical protein
MRAGGVRLDGVRARARAVPYGATAHLPLDFSRLTTTVISVYSRVCVLKSAAYRPRDVRCRSRVRRRRRAAAGARSAGRDTDVPPSGGGKRPDRAGVRGPAVSGRVWSVELERRPALSKKKIKPSVRDSAVPSTVRLRLYEHRTRGHAHGASSSTPVYRIRFDVVTMVVTSRDAGRDVRQESSSASGPCFAAGQKRKPSGNVKREVHHSSDFRRAASRAPALA